MRGGTANCTVVIADEEIGSPLVEHPPLAVALNLPSFDKYEELLQPGGTLVVNQSMVDRGPKRTDIRVLMVSCNQIAEEIGVVLLLQRGRLRLEDRIDQILSELQGSAAGAASIHQLLTHSSGLPGWRPYYERLASLEAGQSGFPGRTAAREAVLGYIAQEALVYEQGSRSLV